MARPEDGIAVFLDRSGEAGGMSIGVDRSHALTRLFLCWRSARSCPRRPGRPRVPIVADGKAVAVVVTADQPTAVARYAAQELVYHVERATGAKLAVVPPRMRAPRRRRPASTWATAAPPGPPESRSGSSPRRRSPSAADGGLFIAGDEGPATRSTRTRRAGTLFGVYEWLERDLGVPLALARRARERSCRRGTIVTAAAVDETIAPHFFQRQGPARVWDSTSDHPALGFTPKAAEQYAKDQDRLSPPAPDGPRRTNDLRPRVHRLVGRSTARIIPTGSSSLPTASAGRRRRAARYSMCVSNPEFQQEVVDRWKAAGGGRPGRHFINAVENDILGLCTCGTRGRSDWECRSPWSSAPGTRSGTGPARSGFPGWLNKSAHDSAGCAVAGGQGSGKRTVLPHREQPGL